MLPRLNQGQLPMRLPKSMTSQISKSQLFIYFCLTLISQRVLYIIKQYQCILEMNYMGLYLTACKKWKYLSTVDY